MNADHFWSLRFGLAARLWFGAVAMLLVASFAPPAKAAPRGLVVSTTNGIMAPFEINADGSLSSRGAPGSGGSTTEGVAITPDAKHVYVANFLPGSGSVGALNEIPPVGNLSALSASPFTTGFQNPLGVAPDPKGRWLFTWNHGASYGINVSTIGADGTLTNISGSPFPIPVGQQAPFGGSVAPDGNHIYVPNESAATAPNTVTVYSVATDGSLSAIQTIATGNPLVQTGPFGSGITPNGKFLYVSNQDDGTDGSISGFAVNPDGTLTALTSGFPVDPGASGKHPSNIAISPDGAHLYAPATNSNAVDAYTIAADGSLTAVPGSPFPTTSGTSPKGAALTPDGKRLYVTNNGTNNISGFDVAADGSLTTIPGSPFPTTITGTNPDLESIAIMPNQPPIPSFTATVAPAGLSTTFDGSRSSDSDGGTVTRYDWTFGDGTALSNGGPTPHHTYARPGTYTATLTVTDDEGCSTREIFTGKATLCNGSAVATTTRTITVALRTVTAPPVTLSRLRVSPKKFSIAGRKLNGQCVKPTNRNSSNKRCRRAIKLTVSYTLDGGATVTFALKRKAPGREVSGRCVKPTSKNRKHRKCTRLVNVEGKLVKTGQRGVNSFVWNGAIGGHRLALGTYQLTATPAGGGPKKVTLEIVR